MPNVRMPDGTVVRFPEGMPSEEIKALIVGKFPELDEAAPKNRNLLQQAEDVIRSLAEGATFGFSGEIAAGADTLLGRGDFTTNLATQEARDAEISSAIGIPGQVAGAIGSTIAAGPVVAPLAARAGITALPRALQFGGLGAAEGALIGAGQASPGSRLEGAATGAAIGAPVGVAAPFIAGGASRLINRIRGAASPQANVSADLGRALVRDQDTPAAIMSRFGQIQSQRPGVASLADVGGENVRGLVERVAQTPGAGRAHVVPRLTGRQQEQANRIGTDLRQLTGTNRTALQATQEVIDQRRQAAQPLYRQAFNFNARNNPDIVRAWENATSTGFGQSILRSPTLRRTLQTEYGIADASDAPLMVLVDAWKKQADDLISSAVRAGNGNQARVLSGMRDRVLQVVDQANPDYAAARNAWSGPSRFLDEVENGRGILSPNMSAEELVVNFGRLGQGEQEAYRIGAVSAIIGRLGNNPARLGDMTRVLRSPEMRAKIAAIMPTPDAAQRWLARLDFEVGSSELTGRALGNSATARRLAERADAENLVGDLVLDAIGGAGSVTLLRRIVTAGPRWLRDTLRSRADNVLGDVLTNPARAGDLPQILQGIGNAGRPIGALPRAGATAAGVELTAPR